MTDGGSDAPGGPPPFPAPRTAFYLHEAGSLHDTGWGHPDHQGRLRALVSAVGKDMLALDGRVEALEPRRATMRELERVHSAAYLASIRARVDEAEAAGGVLEFAPDTPVSAATWNAVVGSSGAVLDAVEAVADGRYASAFVAARPPGHRASRERAAGHCLVNHVAVGARHLQATGRAERVAIVDWDAHPESGTEQIFRGDPSVIWLPLRGSLQGAGADGAAFRSALDRAALDRAPEGAPGAFHPDFVLVSAGYGALDADPSGATKPEPADYFARTRRVLDWADATCAGRVVAVLEGGYDSRATARAALATLRALAGLPWPPG